MGRAEPSLFASIRVQKKRRGSNPPISVKTSQNRTGRGFASKRVQNKPGGFPPCPFAPKRVETGEVDSLCGSSGKNTTRGIPPRHVTVLLVYINIRYNYCRRTLYAHSRLPSPPSPSESLSGRVGEVVSAPG